MSDNLNGTCGECYIKKGETCDICGKSRPLAAEPEVAVKVREVEVPEGTKALDGSAFRFCYIGSCHGDRTVLLADRTYPQPGAAFNLPFDIMIASAKRAAVIAMHKFPAPNYTITKFAEEAGEVVKAAVHCAENRETVENLIGEITQCVAMLYRLYIEGDQVHGLPALAGK